MSACPDRLIADLRRFYGVRLADMEAGLEDALEVAHMVAHMPGGGALGEWVGGEMSLSPEVHALREVTFTIAQVNSKKKLRMPPPPEGIRKREERMRALEMNARRFKRRRKRGR